MKAVDPSFLPPHVHLVLAAVRTIVEDQRERAVESLRDALARSPDPSDVAQTAHLHAVTPLVRRALAEHAPGSAVQEHLEPVVESLAIRNLQLAAELRRVLERLEAEGIHAVPYKGPVLAQQVYGDLALREFVDIDILVEPSRWEEAAAIVTGMGYGTLMPMSPRKQKAHRRQGHDFALVRDMYEVELQWGIAGRPYGIRLDVARLVERATTTPMGGEQVPTLAPLDMVLVLLVHGGLHLWERLSWAADVAQALRAFPQAGAEPAALAELAHEAHASRLAGVGLAVTRALLPGSIPQSLHHLIDQRADQIAQALIPNILANRELPAGPQLRYHVGTKDTRRDALATAWRSAVIPSASDWLAVDLPDPLYPLYVPIRLWRLLTSYLFGSRRPGDRGPTAD